MSIPAGRSKLAVSLHDATPAHRGAGYESTGASETMFVKPDPTRPRGFATRSAARNRGGDEWTAGTATMQIPVTTP